MYFLPCAACISSPLLYEIFSPAMRKIAENNWSFQWGGEKWSTSSGRPSQPTNYSPPPPPPYPSPSPPLGWSGIELFFNFRKQALCCIFFYVKFQTIGEFGRVRAAKFSLSKNHRDLKNAFKKKLQIPSFYFTEQSA